MSCADDIRDNIGDERYFAIILKRIAEKKRKKWEMKIYKIDRWNQISVQNWFILWIWEKFKNLRLNLKKKKTNWIKI